MESKKCISTYLLVSALICLLTLVVPFTEVGFIGVHSTVLKVFYYILTVLYIVFVSLIIIIGIFNLFKGEFEFSVLQEILAYSALLCVVITTIIYAPIIESGLSVGYSILTFETFLMACFNTIFKLIKNMPKILNYFKEFFKVKKEKLEKADNEIENVTVNLSHAEIKIENDDDEKVEIIESDEN